MSFPDTPIWINPLIAASVLLIFGLIIWYPFKRPLNPQGLILISGAEWLLLHAIELSTADLSLKILCLKLKYIGIVMLPISWYLTATAFIYMKKSARNLPRFLISMTPLVTLLLAFTNEYHGLFWRQINLHPENPYMELNTTKGWGYWIFLIFAYSLVANSLAPYVRTVRRYLSAFRVQTALLILGVCLPLISTIFDLLDYDIIPSLELTPLASGISVVLIFNLNQRLRIGSIVPMRRETIIDHMADAIVVLDAHSQVLDMNSAATSFFQIPRTKAIGRKITDIGPPEYGLIWDNILRSSPEPMIANISNHNGVRQTYEISSTPVQLQLSDIWGEIVTLHEITKLQTYQETISTALTEKEKLFREIHHRIRNNLQIVSSLLWLQTKDISDPKLKNIFNESRNRIQAMALVHDKLYQTTDLSNIPLNKYVKDLSQLLIDSQPVGGRFIQLKFEVDPIYVKIDTTISCGLILNELISNAIKHAFDDDQDERIIKVEIIRKSSETLCLSVHDNGSGLPDGFTLEVIDTLGLQLVSTLVKQLNGTIEVQQDSGTKFVINCPIPP